VPDLKSFLPINILVAIGCGVGVVVLAIIGVVFVMMRGKKENEDDKKEPLHPRNEEIQ